jgi:hypothetical protein
MNPVQPGPGDSFQILLGDAGNGVAPGIGGDSFNVWETGLKMGKDPHQVMGLHDQGIGILEKNRFHPLRIPVHGGVKGHPVLFLKTAVQGVDGLIVHETAGLDDLPDSLDITVKKINVFDDIIHGSEGELPFLIYPAKGAVVPGAVPRQPDQKAAGFTGGTDEALLKAFIDICFLSFFFHGSFSTLVQILFICHPGCRNPQPAKI